MADQLNRCAAALLPALVTRSAKLSSSAEKIEVSVIDPRHHLEIEFCVP
jgi:hypothetical protein